MVKHITKWHSISSGGINLAHTGHLMPVNKEKKEWRLSKYLIKLLACLSKPCKRVRKGLEITISMYTQMYFNLPNEKPGYKYLFK